jgi:predicted TIM-barrel enzyme
MTQLLEKALVELQRLPEAGQDAIAAMILEEIADERWWDDAFARSQDQLARLADRVREDIRAGRVKDAGIDEL